MTLIYVPTMVRNVRISRDLPESMGYFYKCFLFISKFRNGSFPSILFYVRILLKNIESSFVKNNFNIRFFVDYCENIIYLPNSEF